MAPKRKSSAVFLEGDSSSKVAKHANSGSHQGSRPLQQLQISKLLRVTKPKYDAFPGKAKTPVVCKNNELLVRNEDDAFPLESAVQERCIDRGKQDEAVQSLTFKDELQMFDANARDVSLHHPISPQRPEAFIKESISQKNNDDEVELLPEKEHQGARPEDEVTAKCRLEHGADRPVVRDIRGGDVMEVFAKAFLLPSEPPARKKTASQLLREQREAAAEENKSDVTRAGEPVSSERSTIKDTLLESASVSSVRIGSSEDLSKSAKGRDDCLRAASCGQAAKKNSLRQWRAAAVAATMAPAIIPSGAQDHQGGSSSASLSPNATTIRKGLQRVDASAACASPLKTRTASNSAPIRTLSGRFKSLEDQFRALQTACAMLRQRSQKCMFNRLAGTVERLTNRKFSSLHLSQLLHLLPDALNVLCVRTVDPDDPLNPSAAKWELEIKIEEAVPATALDPSTGSDTGLDWGTVLRSRLESLGLPESEKLPEAQLPSPSLTSASALHAHSPPQSRPGPSDTSPSFRTPTLKRPADHATTAHPSSATTAGPPPPQCAISYPVSSLTSPSNAEVGRARRSLKDLLSKGGSSPASAGGPGSPMHPRPCPPTLKRPDSASRGASQMVLPKISGAGGEEMMRILSPELLLSMQARVQRAAEETGKEAQAKLRRAQMLEKLPKLLDILRTVYGGEGRTVIPRRMLMNKLVSPSREADSQQDIDEQLQLMLELAPDWLTASKALSGDTLFRINKNVNLAIVRKRLSTAALAS